MLCILWINEGGIDMIAIITDAHAKKAAEQIRHRLDADGQAVTITIGLAHSRVNTKMKATIKRATLTVL